MITETRNYWYNYRTSEYEYRDTPTTFEEAKDYLSQEPSAQGLFEVYHKMGLSLLPAMEKVLIACLPKDMQPLQVCASPEVGKLYDATSKETGKTARVRVYHVTEDGVAFCHMLYAFPGTDSWVTSEDADIKIVDADWVPASDTPAPPLPPTGAISEPGSDSPQREEPS